jgi:hypothetical protein
LGFRGDVREEPTAFFRPILDDKDVDDGKKIKINIEIVNRIINDLVIGHHVQ